MNIEQWVKRDNTTINASKKKLKYYINFIWRTEKDDGIPITNIDRKKNDRLNESDIDLA